MKLLKHSKPNVDLPIAFACALIAMLAATPLIIELIKR